MRFQYDAKIKKPSLKLASPWLIFLSIVIILLLLFLFFPKEALLTNIAKQKQPDKIARQYLHNLLALYPEDVKLKLLLAEQHIALGDIEKAIKTVLPYIDEGPDNADEWKAIWLYYQIVQTDTYQYPEQSEKRKEGIKQMHKMLHVLAKGPFNTQQLVNLLQAAIGLNDSSVVRFIYKRIVNRKPDQPSEVYARLAKAALSYGDYKMSADLYFLAQQQAPLLAHKRDYFIRGLRSLQSGNLLNEAFEIVDKKINELKQDRKTLLFLTHLALSANQPEKAQQYMKRVLYLR